MKKIVSVVRLFTLNQNVFVYEDGNKINVATCSLDDMPETIVNMANEYEVTNVQLIGAKNFLQNIKTKTKELEITKYGKNNLEIELISN